MITPDPIKTDTNEDYITIMKGVGVFQAAHMKWNQHTEEYDMSLVAKPRKNELEASIDASVKASQLRLEVR